MSKIDMLRLLINQRLTAAAEEIFGVFGRTIAEYEEEISRSKLEIERQRRLLELSRKPLVSLEADSSAISDQRNWSSSLDPNEEEPAIHIKEEDQDVDVWTDQPGENNVTFVLFRSSGAVAQRDDDRAGLNFQNQHLEDSDIELYPGPSVQQSCSELGEDRRAASGNGQDDAAVAVADSYICTVCGQAFYQRGEWAKHARIHRKVGSKAGKSFTCDICGKRLTRLDGYQKHLRVHTGEKPYSCHVCGRSFSDNSNYKRHIRRHTREKSQPSSG